jgi:hypothetical protein
MLMIDDGVSLEGLARQMALSEQEVAVRYGHLFEERSLEAASSASTRIEAARAATVLRRGILRSR